MFMTLIEKEILHNVLSIRFAALLLMCLLLVPLTLSINYRKYDQHRVDYQESVKRAAAAKENPPNTQDPNTEVSRLFLKPTPLSVFANGLMEALPNALGMTRNGIRHGTTHIAQTPFSHVLGELDFLFLVSTVFSLLALLFTFDAVTGEREAGTLRITLANPLPRDILLWSKLVGGYLVFIVPFLVSVFFGLFVLVWHGFPLGESDYALRILFFVLASLLYIAVFFAIGTLISTYSDSPKTALIVAFCFWVFAVLIAPRTGFLSAKLIAPTRTAQEVYLEKAVLRDNIKSEKQDEIGKKVQEVLGTRINMTPAVEEKFAELKKPIDEVYRLKFKNQADKIDQEYQREKAWQEAVGEIASRITPTSAFIYLGINLTRTGKLTRDAYFQTGNRYYALLDENYFKKFPLDDDPISQLIRLSGSKQPEKVPPPLEVPESALAETLHHSVIDVLLLCFFAVALTIVTFLKFLRSDI